MDRLGATIECGIVHFQPIHSENEVYGGRLQNDWGNKEYNSFDFDGGIWHQLGGTALADRGANFCDTTRGVSTRNHRVESRERDPNVSGSKPYQQG